ncbi:MAG: hypothetical protein ACJAWS_003303 [Oleiphilaceae bacterium]|jgi:hypothetical protein
MYGDASAKGCCAFKSNARNGGLMKSPNEMNKWFESKRKEFEALPDS